MKGSGAHGARGFGLALALCAACARGSPPVLELDVIPCVRLLNSTGQVGCATPRDGVRAPLFDLATLGAAPLGAETLAALGSAAKRWSGARAVLLDARLFCAAALDALHATLGDRLGGVVVVAPPAVGSDDDGAPLDAWGGLQAAPATSHAGAMVDSSGAAWNPAGDGLNEREFRFPIARATDASSAQLRTLAARGAAARARRGGDRGGAREPVVDFRLAMLAAGSSASCLPLGLCLPLGGQSVWALVTAAAEGGGSRATATGDVASRARPLVWLSASLDGAAFFHEGRDPAGLAALAGAVAAVAAAAALGSPAVGAALGAAAAAAAGSEVEVGQIALALFHGEAYGALGSGRLVADLLSANEKARFCEQRQGEAEGDPARAADGAVRPCAQPWRASGAWERHLLERDGGARRVRSVLHVGSVGAAALADVAVTSPPARAPSSRASPVTPFLHAHRFGGDAPGAAAARAATAAALRALSGGALGAAGAGAYGRALAQAGPAGEGGGLPPDSAARSFVRLVETQAAAAAAGRGGGGGGGGGGGAGLLTLSEAALGQHAVASSSGSGHGGRGDDAGDGLGDEHRYGDGFGRTNAAYGGGGDDGAGGRIDPAAVCAAADTAARAALLLAGLSPAAVARALLEPTMAETADGGGKAAAARGGGGGGGGGVVGARVDCALVSELLHCLLPWGAADGAAEAVADGASSCALADSLGVAGALRSHYVGVYVAGPALAASISPTAELLQRLLAALLPQTDGSLGRGLGARADGRADDAQSCSADLECGGEAAAGAEDALCVRGACVRAPSAFVHDAFSTGIGRDDAQAPWRVVDASQPNWAEPFWEPLTVRAWEYGASTAEGWALLGAGALGAAVTYAAVVLGQATLEQAAATRR